MNLDRLSALPAGAATAAGRSLTSGVRSHGVLAGVLLLPALLGGLTVWSLGDRIDEVDQVPAAVVNLDEPVLGKNPVAAGRLLAAGLTSPAESTEPPFDWTLTDRSDAAEGLESGEYHAVLVVPKDFSRTVSSSVKGKDPRRATVTVDTADGSSALVDEISAQVATVSADRLNRSVTTTYLATMFEQTGKLGKQLGEAADGADRLADGTQELGQGTKQFAGGLQRLADGGDQLASGADRLAAGTDRLAQGTDQLAGGSRGLSDGLGTLARRTDPLPGQTRKLADGAGQVARGVEGYAKLLKGWNQACANPLIAAQAVRLCAATQQAVGPGGSTADQLTSGAEQVAGGADRLAGGLTRLESGIDRAASGADRLADGAGRLASGSQRLVDGTEQLADGAGRLADGAGEAASGATELASGSRRLGDGSRQLADGLDRGADQVPSYDEDEGQKLADVIAEPVAARTADDGQGPDSRTELAPGTLALMLWLGAFVAFLVRPALPQHLLGRPRSALALAGAGLLPGAVLGVVQALLLFATTLALGVQIASPGATLLVLLAGAVAFAAVHQALVALLGRRRGWIASIALAGLQVVALGGLVPLDAAPWGLRALNAVLPMTSTADGLVVTVLDGPGSVVATLVVLALWAGASLGGTVVAARRAQQVDWERLRAEVEVPSQRRERELVG